MTIIITKNIIIYFVLDKELNIFLKKHMNHN